MHERVVAELLETATPGCGYARLPERERLSLLIDEIATVRPLISPFANYSEETSAEIDVLREAAQLRRDYGRSAIANYIISMANGVSDILEVLYCSRKWDCMIRNESGSISTSCRCSRP